MIVMSPEDHFEKYKHRDYSIHIDGKIMLQCCDCEAQFEYHETAKRHMVKYKHNEMKGRLDKQTDETGAWLQALGPLTPARKSSEHQCKDNPSPDHMSLDQMPVDSSKCEMDDTDMMYKDDFDSEFDDSDAQSESFQSQVSMVSQEATKFRLSGIRTLAPLNLSDVDIQKLRKKYIFAEDMAIYKVIRKVKDILASSTKNKYLLMQTNINSTNDEYIEYNDLLQQLCLIKTETLRDSSDGSKQSKAKTLRLGKLLDKALVWLTKKQLVRMREVKYICPELYPGDKIADDDLTEIVGMTGVTRESLNVRTNTTGMVAGSVLLFIGETLLADCSLGGSSGCKIPSETHLIDDIWPNKGVKFILVVEKDTMFQALTCSLFHKRHRCIIITGSGVPDVYTRLLLRKLRDYFQIPIYGLFDGNPSGASMHATYRFGSANRAFDLSLSIPEMIWIGLFPSLVPKKYTKEVVEKDKVLNKMLNKNYIFKDPVLLSQLSRMIDGGLTADMDYLSCDGILEEYILNRIDDSKEQMSATVANAEYSHAGNHSPTNFAVPAPPTEDEILSEPEDSEPEEEMGMKESIIADAIEAGANEMISLKDALDQLDTKFGKCGTNMCRGATAVLKYMKNC